MQICKTKKEIEAFITPYLSKDKTIGFVPTMGALHNGHLSLVQKSVGENDLTVASIFVNPTQFNNPDDLKNYPRNFNDDIRKLEKAGCQVVFIPDTNEMYPEKDDRLFSFDGIESKMEGEHRPGHFNGVAQIVSKLFDIVPANRAYFGLKDFQQLAIIKSLVKQLKLPISIVACNTIRESDGLAMSSRNALLLDEHRSTASIIYKTMVEASSIIKEIGIEPAKQYVKKTIEETNLTLEYFDIVDDSSLETIPADSQNYTAIACIAVWAGKVRLIDNIQINL